MITKTYGNYVGNSVNGFDSGSELARFASAHQQKYTDAKFNISINGFESVGKVQATKKTWEKIKEDFLSDFQSFYGMECPHNIEI